MSTRYTSNGAERRRIRAALHAERPLVQIGRGGLTEAVIESAAQALAANEAIKISVGKGCEEDPAAAAEELAQRLDAELIETKGRTAMLYRPEDEPSSTTS